MKTIDNVPTARALSGLLRGVAAATALGCLVQPSLAWNGSETPAPSTDIGSAAAPSSDWLGLSGELNGLSATLQDQMGPTTVGGLIRGQIQQSDDFGYGVPNAETLGAQLDDAKLFGKGSIGDFDWRIMFDFANRLDPTWFGAVNGNSFSPSGGSPVFGDTAVLQEAYGNWNFYEGIGLIFGQFRAHRSFSNTVYSEQLLFQNRTLIGELGYRFDKGIMLHGNYAGPLSWYLSAQNGADDVQEDFEYVGRVEWAFGAGAGNGEGGIVMPGGNQNGDQFNGAIGGTYGDEGAVSDGSYYGIDFVGRVAGFFINGEFFSYDDDWAGALGGALGTGFTEGPSFWSASVGYLLPGDQWELAARYQDLDDTEETSLITLGVNYYVAGHNAKWQLNYTDVSSDGTDLEGSLISLGLTLGLEGY
jgi:hypothetical protein